MSRGGKIFFFACLGVSAAIIAPLSYFSPTPRAADTLAPAPRVAAASLELSGHLDLPNGYQLYTVRVDATPLPYQCLVLATPQAGTLHCDIDAVPNRHPAP